MYVLTNAVRHCRMLNQYRQIASKQCRGGTYDSPCNIETVHLCPFPNPLPCPVDKNFQNFSEKITAPLFTNG